MNVRFGLIKKKHNCKGYNPERGFTIDQSLWFVLTPIELSWSSNFSDFSSFSLLYRQDLTLLSLANLISLRKLSGDEKQKLAYKLLSFYPAIALGYGFVDTGYSNLGNGLLFEGGLETGNKGSFQLIRLQVFYRGMVYENRLSNYFGVATRISIGMKSKETIWGKY